MSDREPRRRRAAERASGGGRLIDGTHPIPFEEAVLGTPLLLTDAQGNDYLAQGIGQQLTDRHHRTMAVRIAMVRAMQEIDDPREMSMAVAELVNAAVRLTQATTIRTREQR